MKKPHSKEPRLKRGFLFLYTIYYKTFSNMAKLFKLTEEQYRFALKEGLVGDNGSNTTTTGKPKLSIQVDKTQSKTLDKSYEEAANTVKANNLHPKDVNFVVNDKTKTSESYIISKKELSENRQKKLKENSITYTVSDFLNKINK